jgi:hypothetical protein
MMVGAVEARRLRGRRGAVLAGVLGALSLAGCGLGAGPTPGAVQLTVTRGFGESELGLPGPLKVTGQETVMSLLMRNYTVSTRYGGGFVQSINGLAGGQEGDRPVDWFYYVNGVQASRGATSTDVRQGDRVWWDLHDWSQTQDVPAVVGSFPQPFLTGIEGKRLPVRIECAEVSGAACRTVTSRLQELGVPAAVAGVGPSEDPLNLRVVVGPWASVRLSLPAEAIEQGPRSSGVYARFTSGGSALELLDQNGAVTSTLHAGAGLIAATRHGEDDPVWFVTGTDEAGAALAARAFQEGELRNRFALALAPGGAVPLPDGAAG